jgi:hypothetical protein
MPTDVEIAWTAGLLDGEAWFGHAGNSARISLAMVDLDLVTRYAQIWDLAPPRPVPPPKHRSNRQMQWGSYAYGRRALEIMQAVLPYLGERRTAKVREIERLMGQKYDPRPCVECGTLFVPHQRATLGQRYCAASCQGRAKKRRQRAAYAAALGRTPDQRCGVSTASGPCRIFPLKGQHRCRHHVGVA